MGGMGLLLLLAFGLRLHRLAEPPLWGDEGLSLYRARASWSDLLRGRIVLQGLQPIETIDNHPPLYFAALKAWVALAGDSEFALRFPSVFASILLIPLIWTTGRRLREPTTAWAGAAGMAASSLYLWYAQEARMYTLLALESALLLFLLLPPSRGEPFPTRRLVAVLLTLLAMIWTHYTAILLVPALGLWALTQPRRDLRRLAWGLLIPLLPLGALFPFFSQRLASGPERDYFFVPLEGILTDVLRASAFGTSFPYGDPRSWPLQWLWVGMIGVGIGRLIRHTMGAGSLLLAAFLGPLLGLYGLSHWKPLYQNIRHLFLVTPVVYLWASLGLAALARRFPRLAVPVGGALLAGMLLSDARYFSDPYPLKDDWRGALTWVSARAAPEDVVVLQDLQLTPLAGYYYRGAAPLVLAGRDGEAHEALVRRLEDWPRPIERVWLITGLSDEALSRPQQVLFHWLGRRGRYLTQEVFPSRNIWVRVLVYDFSSVICAPSPRTLPLDVGFGSYFRLRGFEPESDGSFLRTRFFWEKGTASSLNLWLRIRLVDADGTTWAQEIQPIWPSYPPDRWPEGKPVCQQVRSRLPPGLPPGHYRLRVEAFDLEQGIPADGAPAWESPAFFIEGHTELPAPSSPIVRSIGGLQLLSAQPEVNPPYFPGLGVPLRLLWQAEASPPKARTLALFWQQGGERRELFRGELGPSSFPATQWRAGQVVAQRIWVPLPPDLRGYGQLRLALYDEEGRELPWEALWPFHHRSYPLFSISLSSWPIRRQPIPFALRGQGCFADQVCLDRYEIVPTQAAPGQMVEVRLSWRVLRRPERPGVVFVHLSRSPDQPPLASGDAPPQEGRRPVLTWEPGEYVEDIHRLPIPQDLPPGPYKVFIGWYSDLERWPAKDPMGARYPMDAVPLGEIEVRP